MTPAATFPKPGPCPDWCDQRHGFLGKDEWESEDRMGVEMVRSHAKNLGRIAGKVGIEVIADTTAERGGQPVTSAPVLAIDTNPDDPILNASEARQFAQLLVAAADELEYNILGGGSDE
jgi:hypothetical protein